MASLYVLMMVASLSAAQDTPAAPAATCRESHECQRLALEAYARGDFERFHDLAWRTVQTGSPRDPGLMYLLARAQSLSGRPHDALVMLGRLAEMGVATDAATNDDFQAVRQLRQWPELEAAIAAIGQPAAIAAVARPPTVSPPVVPPRQPEEALRIPGTVLGSAGLAYDRVSSRFVVADADLRKLMIIDERSRHVVDLVTSSSAGFYDITGLEIDPARGDLWVVSAQPEAAAGDRSPASALHKLQLVSGRPLERIQVPAGLQPCRLVDVAVMANGGVLVLDAVGGRILRLQPATRTFTPVATLHLESPTSLAPAGDQVVYVAYASGIARVDAATGSVESLAGARDVPLTGFERIRWALDSLVGVQRLPDGSQRAVRIRIVGGRATAADVIDAGLSAADRPVSTVSGDEFYFVAHQPAGAADDLVIRRTRLR